MARTDPFLLLSLAAVETSPAWLQLKSPKSETPERKNETQKDYQDLTA